MMHKNTVCQFKIRESAQWHFWLAANVSVNLQNPQQPPSAHVWPDTLPLTVLDFIYELYELTGVDKRLQGWREEIEVS